jgi:hypothetical protein
MSNPQQLATDKLFRETMHVAAGDTLAVGTACDSWTYVQHVGKDRVRRGWIETDRLAKLVVDLPFDGGDPGGQDPKQYPKHVDEIVRIGGSPDPVQERTLDSMNSSIGASA